MFLSRHGADACGAGRSRGGPFRKGDGIRRAAVLTLFIVAALAATVSGTSLYIENIEGGPRIVLEPHPESDIVCLAVSVPTGSAFETPDTRGMSHFLEHMVFDGTELWSRIEMSDWIDERGAFLNAFTRKETAVYFLVVTRDDLERGMELLSQMLLHSIFPPEEFEKERKIILEELRKGMDDPTFKRERLVDRYLYRGSALTGPVMGYASTIETMRREDVMQFYRERYRPGLMRIHIAGGFDLEQVGRWIRDYFPVETQQGKSFVPAYEGPDLDPRWSGEVTVRNAGDLEPGFDIIIHLPAPGEKHFPAALLVANILQGESSPLPALFDSLSLPEPEVGFEVHARFSALRIHLPWSEEGKGSYGGVPEALAKLADWEPPDEAIESARTAHLSAELFDREKYHFYIMLHGEKIGLFGGTYLDAAIEGIRKVTMNDCRRFIRTVFEPLSFNACLLRPGTAAPQPSMRTGGESRTLRNGCIITARTRSNSGVAALHILIKGRNCLDEKAGLMGMSALLHALFESSAAGKELSRGLEALGCRLQWQDNPYIPMDDYYLNPSFSFVRLEAPADRVEQAARLLVDFLRGSRLTEEDLARTMGSFGMELRVRGGSASAALSEIVYRELLGDHPYGSPIFPKPELLRGVEIEQLSSFRDDCMRGGNMIVSLVSPLRETDAIDLLDRLLSDLPAGESGGCPPLPASGSYREVTDTTRKEGAYLAAGWLVREESPDRLAALFVAAQVLSRRMQLELREKQGLTYSTGCGVTLFPGGAVAMATIGTRGQNLGAAESGLKAEIERLAAEPPATGEIETAKSRLLGRRARSELSSINEASAACLDLFMTGEEVPMNVRIARVAAEDVTAVAAALAIERALLVRLVPGEGDEEESAPPAMRMRMR
jgi:zinc protease